MKDLTILVVNDDGPSSPLLGPFLQALASQLWCKELRVAIPAENHSWKASAVTRYGKLPLAEIKIGPHRVCLVGGTPADTASIGIFNLWPEPPDLLLSGINIGENMATPFFYCSGTIGAAGIGALSRVPALAFSLAVPSEIFRLWKEHNEDHLSHYHAHWQCAAEVSALLTQRLYEARFWEQADLFSINMPFTVSSTTRAAVTHLQRGYFRRIFRQEGRYFSHVMEPPDFPADLAEEDSDRRVLDSGKISVTPLNISSSVNVPASFCDAVSG
jgi:5'-nucleotidase